MDYVAYTTFDCSSKFKVLKHSDSYHSLINTIGLPFVIKPVDSCGSHRVYIVRTVEDFDRFSVEVDYISGQYEVEEFITGKLFHVDSFIKDGVLRFICANEYTCPNYDYTNGKVLASIPLDDNSDTAISLISFAKKCLEVLGVNNLINHMELFITTDEEVVFLEVSGRPPGGFLNLTHQFNFGINLIDEDFMMQSGVDVEIEKSHYDEKAFFAIFPLLPGKITNLLSPTVNSEYQMKWYVTKDEVITEGECKNVVSKSAHAVFFNADESQLRRDFEIIKHFTAIEVSP